MLRRTLITYLILGFAAISLIAGGSWQVPETTRTVYGVINGDGDTAQVVKFHDFVAKDSFSYIDTIGPTSTKIAVKWTSPVQKIALTVDADSAVDSAVYEDTIIFPSTDRLGVRWVSPLYEMTVTPTTALDLNPYECSVFFAADTLVATWTAPGSGTSVAMVCDSMAAAIEALADLTDSVTGADGTTNYTVTSLFAELNVANFTLGTDTACTATITANNSVAMYCDSIAALIEAEANLTDTVTAHDSGTYVLVSALWSHNNLGGRFTVKQTSNQDTATGGRIATVLMVIDSMVAAINGTATLVDSVTAANDGDTVYTVTSWSGGWGTYIGIGDTAQDTALITANATSNSILQDTLENIGRTIFSDWHATSIDGRFVLGASDSTGLGIGLSDSGYLWLYYVTTRGEYSLADSAFRAALPCTLSVEVADAEGNNVVFADNLALVWRVSDTASDTTRLTIPFDITYDYTLKD